MAAPPDCPNIPWLIEAHPLPFSETGKNPARFTASALSSFPAEAVTRVSPDSAHALDEHPFTPANIAFPSAPSASNRLCRYRVPN